MSAYEHTARVFVRGGATGSRWSWRLYRSCDYGGAHRDELHEDAQLIPSWIGPTPIHPLHLWGGVGKSIVHMASPCAIDLQYSFAHITYFSNTMGSKKINKTSLCSFANALQVACSQYVYNFANMFLNIEHIFAICLPSCKHIANIKGLMCNTFAI